jgi:hypothetical protein
MVFSIKRQIPNIIADVSENQDLFNYKQECFSMAQPITRWAKMKRISLDPLGKLETTNTFAIVTGKKIAAEKGLS